MHRVDDVRPAYRDNRSAWPRTFRKAPCLGGLRGPHAHLQNLDGGAGSQSRSTAKRLRSASEQKLKAPSCVARKTTRGARPACSASCHRGAHRHQRSSGLSPGKPNSGTGVERSLPQDFEYSRNPAVMTAHTVWLPISSRLVSQQPSRKKPVIGLKEQTSSRSPSTFLGSLRRPPPLPASSLNIGILCIVDTSSASKMSIPIDPT